MGTTLLRNVLTHLPKTSGTTNQKRREPWGIVGMVLDRRKIPALGLKQCSSGNQQHYLSSELQLRRGVPVTRQASVYCASCRVIYPFSMTCHKTVRARMINRGALLQCWQLCSPAFSFSAWLCSSFCWHRSALYYILLALQCSVLHSVGTAMLCSTFCWHCSAL
jgi:hypothetical protein